MRQRAPPYEGGRGQRSWHAIQTGPFCYDGSIGPAAKLGGSRGHGQRRVTGLAKHPCPFLALVLMAVLSSCSTVAWFVGEFGSQQFIFRAVRKNPCTALATSARLRLSTHTHTHAHACCVEVSRRALWPSSSASGSVLGR